MVQLRLKMKLPTKSSKWMVTNSSFYMRAPSGRGICGRTLFGLANFMWWCALNDTWGVSFPFLLYVVSLFAFHYLLILRKMRISSVGGGIRKKSICFLFLLFLLLFFLYSISIFVPVFVFYFCSAVLCSVCFSVSIVVCCSIFSVVFYFMVCCVCFVLLFYYFFTYIK